MRRRSFLLTTAALTLPACSPGPGPRPVIPPEPPLPTVAPPPSAPPTPDAVPRAFAGTPVWPTSGQRASIHALHRHHLCGAVFLSADDDQQPRSLPVVVDLTGPTTLAVLGAGGTFTTHEVDPGSSTDKAQIDEFGPELILVRAVMDDDHAYVVVAHPHHTHENPEKDHADLHLLKIALGDGAVTASLSLHEGFPDTTRWWLSLSLSADGATLLVAGADPQGRHQPPHCFGVRVASADLAVQFDASTAIPDTASKVSVEGDALHVLDETAGDSLVVLANGRVVPMPRSQLPHVVGDSCYLNLAENSFVLRNLGTDEDTALPDLNRGLLHDLGRPAIWTRDPLLFAYAPDSREPQASAWIPGVAAPALSWSGNRLPIPSMVARFRDVIYHDASQPHDDTLVLQSMTTGELIDATPWGAHGLALAVSAWGVATDEVFMPATEWVRS